MKLPDGYKIIGIIVADIEEVEGDIFWDKHFLAKESPLALKDILKDVAGLADKQYLEIDIWEPPVK